jgi:hypothetical protein
MNKIAETSEQAWGIQEKYKNQPHGWIQWKGTNVCMDIHCKCGDLTHVDESFAYNVKCGTCGTVYMCNGHIELIEVKNIDPTMLIVKSE